MRKVIICSWVSPFPKWVSWPQEKKKNNYKDGSDEWGSLSMGGGGLLANSPLHVAAPSSGPGAPLDQRGERAGNDEERKGNKSQLDSHLVCTREGHFSVLTVGARGRE